MEIRILGAHNCESPDTGLISILIDQALVIDAGSITSSLPFSAQRGLKAIFLTHQHFDHVRDLATLGLNLYGQRTIELYALESVLDVVSSCLFSDKIYLDFRNRPTPEKPTFKFCPVEPYKEVVVQGYAVLPLPVNHGMSAVGYQVTSRDKKSFFFSGDTGRNNPSFWQAVSAQLVIIEVTFPNSHQTLAMESSHLTPQFLKEELGKLKGVRGSLPPVVTVHMNPELEGEIREEVEQVSRELGAEITLGYEGMTIVL